MQARPRRPNERGAKDFGGQPLIRCPCRLYRTLARCTSCFFCSAACLTRTPKQRSGEQSQAPDQIEEEVIEYIDPQRRLPEGIQAFLDHSAYSQGAMPERSSVAHGTPERINQIAFKFWKQKGSSTWGYTLKYQNSPTST